MLALTVARLAAGEPAGPAPRVLASGLSADEVRERLARHAPEAPEAEVLALAALAAGAPLRSGGEVRLVPCRGVVGSPDLRAAAAAALEETLDGDDAAALRELDAALSGLPCAREVVPVEDVVRLYYLRGAAQFGRWEQSGDPALEAEALAAFRAARTLSPSLGPDEATFGPAMNGLFGRAEPAGSARLVVLPPPDAAHRVTLDGFPFAVGPDPVPVARGRHLLQVVGPTVTTALVDVDGDGAVLLSAFVTSDLASWVGQAGWLGALDLLMDAYSGPVDWIVLPEGAWRRVAGGWEAHPEPVAPPVAPGSRRRRLTVAGAVVSGIGASVAALGLGLAVDASAWGRSAGAGQRDEADAYAAARTRWQVGHGALWSGGALAGAGAALVVAGRVAR